MKKITVDNRYSIYVFGNKGFLTTDHHINSLIVSMSDCFVTSMSCLCANCVSSDYDKVFEAVRNNKLETLIVSNNWYPVRMDEAGNPLIEEDFPTDFSLQTMDNLDEGMRRIPWDNEVHQQFSTLADLFRWILSQPSILFKTESVSQYRSNSSCNFIRAIDQDTFFWLKKLAECDKVFDSLTFLERLNSKRGKTLDEVDVNSLIDDL